MYTRRKFGPRPSSVARALGVQSRENWQVTTGSVSDDLEPTGLIQTRNKFRIFKEHRQICRVCSTTNHHHHHHYHEQEKPPPHLTTSSHVLLLLLLSLELEVWHISTTATISSKLY